MHSFFFRYISSKFRNEQQLETVQGNIHSKVAILRYYINTNNLFQRTHYIIYVWFLFFIFAVYDVKH